MNKKPMDERDYKAMNKQINKEQLPLRFIAFFFQLSDEGIRQLQDCYEVWRRMEVERDSPKPKIPF